MEFHGSNTALGSELVEITERRCADPLLEASEEQPLFPCGLGGLVPIRTLKASGAESFTYVFPFGEGVVVEEADEDEAQAADGDVQAAGEAAGDEGACEGASGEGACEREDTGDEGTCEDACAGDEGTCEGEGASGAAAGLGATKAQAEAESEGTDGDLSAEGGAEFEDEAAVPGEVGADAAGACDGDAAAAQAEGACSDAAGEADSQDVADGEDYSDIPLVQATEATKPVLDALLGAVDLVNGLLAKANTLTDYAFGQVCAVQVGVTERGVGFTRVEPFPADKDKAQSDVALTLHIETTDEMPGTTESFSAVVDYNDQGEPIRVAMLEYVGDGIVFRAAANIDEKTGELSIHKIERLDRTVHAERLLYKRGRDGRPERRNDGVGERDGGRGGFGGRGGRDRYDDRRGGYGRDEYGERRGGYGREDRRGFGGGRGGYDDRRGGFGRDRYDRDDRGGFGARDDRGGRGGFGGRDDRGGRGGYGGDRGGFDRNDRGGYSRGDRGGRGGYNGGRGGYGRDDSRGDFGGRDGRSQRDGYGSRGSRDDRGGFGDRADRGGRDGYGRGGYGGREGSRDGYGSRGDRDGRSGFGGRNDGAGDRGPRDRY